MRNTEALCFLDSIRELSFSNLKRKIMDPLEGEGWSEEEFDFGKREYERFLQLLLVFPDEIIVPTRIMDTVWHYHILDTRAYERDTKRIFGKFLHHNPNFGLGGELDRENLSLAAKRTFELYHQTFGEFPKSSFSFCAGDSGNDVPTCSGHGSNDD